ncbi:MAG: U32 family peptidase [Mycoplasmatota bacterium]
MKKIVIPNSLKQIYELVSKVDGFLISIEDLSINAPYYFNLLELEEINKLLIENKKELFVSLNKNIHQSELEQLKKTLIFLEKLEIKSIFFYDLSIVNLKETLNLKNELTWASEHLTTNYATINFYYELGNKGTYLSSNLTIDEVNEIRKNTKSKLFFNIFGYLPMYTSKRRVVKNYIEKFKINKKQLKIDFIKKEGNVYPIVDENNGTTIYSSNILNGLLEIEKLDVDYLILNSFNIDDFEKVIDIFNNEKSNEKLEKMFSNLDKGFMYKETIYRVKK